MLNKLANLIVSLTLIIGLAVVTYVWRDELARGGRELYGRIESVIYPPCTRPITYQLGDFDQRFGITTTEFSQALREAELIWEQAIDKDLFALVGGSGDVTVNLTYDDRQQATDELETLDSSLERDRAGYDTIKREYERQHGRYQEAQIAFAEYVNEYEQQRQAYEQEVARVNQRGGANEQQYQELERSRQELNQKLTALKTEQEELKRLQGTVNELVRQLNERARELNLTVAEYNTIGEQVGEEFDEGVYRSDQSGRHIDVFQFNDQQQLVRLLAHEFGHALGIDHVDDPTAIMYRLNQSQNLVVTEDDLQQLKIVCRLP